jgi:hypothetical protein
MSGESVGTLAVGAIGAMSVMGRAAGASCAFVVGGSLTALGRHLEHREAEREADRLERGRWEHVLREVAVRNAQIGALDAFGGIGALGGAQAGGLAPPVSLVLGGQDLAELERWCAQADTVLRAAEREAVDRATEALLQRTRSSPGRQAAAGPAAALREDAEPEPGPSAAAGAWDREPLLADMRRIVVRLALEVGEAQREAVAAAAQRVAGAPSRTEARNRLGDLRVRVERANAAAAAARAQAVEAAGLLQPLGQAGASAEPLRAALREVVAARRLLTPQLAEEARQVAATLQRAADRAYVRSSIEASLTELGYEVDEGFQTGIPVDGVLQVRRSEWTAHGVRMILDGEKQQLRATVVRTAAAGSWDEDRVDVERETQWCATLGKLEASLAEKGIAYGIRSLTEPGSRSVPVVRAIPSAAPAPGQADVAGQRGQPRP